jgi:outer membrane cobalamin receptor
MKKRIYTVIIFLFLLSSIVHAYEFKGRVLNFETLEPIVGVSVRIEKTKFGAYTNKKGEFSIKNIDAGVYSCKISMIGFKSKKIELLMPKMADSLIEINLEENIIRTKDVVVTAGKKIQSVQEVPISMSIIDLKSIQKRNSTDIDKILEYVPGVKMNGTQVSIRGSSGFALGVGSRVAFLIDGFPVLSGDQGDMKFDIIPTFVIQKIEIVKGAGSALYGSGALGGVINAITEQAEAEQKIKFKAYSGLFTKTKYESWKHTDDIPKYFGIEGSYSQKFDKTSLLFSTRYLQDDSYRKFDERQNYSIFSKINHAFNNQSAVQLNISHTYNLHHDWVYWKSLDSATVPPDDTDLSLKVTSLKTTAFVSYKHIFDEDNFIEIKSGILRTDFSNNAQENTSDYRSSLANSFNNEIQLNNSLLNNLLLTSGVNYVYNAVEASIYGERNQQTAALYSQMEWKPFYNWISAVSNIDYKNMILTAGIRGDYEKTEESDGNQELSPKLGWVLRLADKTNLRASLGKGFRTATISEKFASFNFGPFKVKPNANIIPETNFTYEFGINQELEFSKSFFLIDVSFFANHLDNMIEATFVEENNDFFIQFRNISEAKVMGLELDLKTLLFGFLGVQTSLTLMDAQDLILNEPLKYRSDILWYNGIMLPLGNFEVNADYRFISRPETVDVLLDKFIPDASARVDAHVVDLRLIYHLKDLLNQDLSVILNANNLLDYYYTIYPGNLAPTRSITFQLTATF